MGEKIIVFVLIILTGVKKGIGIVSVIRVNY